MRAREQSDLKIKFINKEHMENNYLSRIINSDDDAWQLLADWIDGMVTQEVTFTNWPILSIKISGDDYQNSLNSGQMAALVDLKMVMGRTYAVIAHGAYDMRRLRREEEEQLQFTTKVKKGSSILDTDLTPLIQAFSSAISSHPGLSVIAASILGLALVARPIILRYYDDRAKQLEANERKHLLDLSLNSTENKKYLLFQEAIKKFEKIHPQFAQVLPDARESFWRFAAASVDADRMSVAGIDMTQDDLEILSERRRKRPGDIQEVEQEFKVVSVRKIGEAFKIGLESNNLAISALYRKPQLSDARIKRLMNCMASENTIMARVDVRTVDQAQLSGRLISFKPIADD